jgi:pimeloyl-ACP methyl ester carboxylesterase
MATIILIHGAWHGGWCWKKVAPLLRAYGHQVFTPTLTGLGERAHLLNPLIDLETHIQDIAHVVTYEDLTEVVLVGHSYAGFILTALADRIPERLARLIYLDAFVPQTEQSLFDLVAPDSRTAFEAAARDHGEQWRVPAPPLSRWGITAAEDIRWMLAKVCPQPIKTFTERLTLRHESAPVLPRAYIACTVEQKPHYATTAQWVRSQSDWTYAELPTGHDPMVTLPNELVRRLAAIIL